MAAQVVAKAIAILAILATLSSQATAVEVLFSGQTLFAGQSIENGPYRLLMQNDCNLVLYINGNRALWASGTVGKGTNCRATLQRDANLVVYSGSNALWASGTARGQGNYVLLAQFDGNVVIYGPAIWATNSVQSASRKLKP
ncbi:Mannose-specific lectin [Nymphaea thermarum]|nr:Mannose-specific lectin [Nymphaea thermarum]